MNLPDHVIATVIHERVRTPQPRKLVVCPVCGNAEDQTDWIEETTRTSVTTRRQCDGCDDVERNHPVLFEWVTRVIAWHGLLHHPGPLCKDESGDVGRIKVCNLPLDENGKCPAGCSQPVHGW